MNIRVNDINGVQNVGETQNKAVENDAFKFTLQGKIEEGSIESKVTEMLSNIAVQGELIGKRMDIRDMRRYRTMIQEVMNEIVNHSHKFSRENFLDRRGRHRVYGMIRLVNEKLDMLAEELMKNEKDHIKILDAIGEIQGLILDIFT